MFIETEYRNELSFVYSAINAALKTLETPTAESIAKAIFAALQKVAVSVGQSADEVGLIAPGEPCYFDTRTPQWVVSWEAGPYEWAVGASLGACGFPQLAEPYYGFDLCFYPQDDP